MATIRTDGDAKSVHGGMNASQYKDYVLVLLFMKYVSDRYAGDPDGQIFVPEGSRFSDLVALKGDKEIGDKLNKAIAALAEEDDLTGVITLVDFNDPDKLGKGWASGQTRRRRGAHTTRPAAPARCC